METEKLTRDDLYQAMMDVWARRAAVEAGYSSLKDYVDHARCVAEKQTTGDHGPEQAA